MFVAENDEDKQDVEEYIAWDGLIPAALKFNCIPKTNDTTSTETEAGILMGPKIGILIDN